MKHEALKSEAYLKAVTFMKEGTSFIIQNQYEERKWFVKGSSIYNHQSLQNYFKISYDLGDELVVISCTL